MHADMPTRGCNKQKEKKREKREKKTFSLVP
jgi:hypothetical protein